MNTRAPEALPLADTVVLGTGGGSGIGQASALAFAHAGAIVVVADVDAAGGHETVNRLTASGGQARFVRADVSRAEDVELLVAAVVEAYGRLDCAHNNAGIEGEVTLLADYPEEAFDRVIAVNLKGVWLCMKHEIAQMVRQGGGAIVNTAAVAGLIGSSYLPAYAAS
jgi:NAD(P)-dependent dehydrogenase (short-subunit alcohol dehydrogenase family)